MSTSTAQSKISSLASQVIRCYVIEAEHLTDHVWLGSLLQM